MGRGGGGGLSTAGLSENPLSSPDTHVSPSSSSPTHASSPRLRSPPTSSSKSLVLSRYAYLHTAEGRGGGGGGLSASVPDELEQAPRSSPRERAPRRAYARLSSSSIVLYSSGPASSRPRWPPPPAGSAADGDESPRLLEPHVLLEPLAHAAERGLHLVARLVGLERRDVREDREHLRARERARRARARRARGQGGTGSAASYPRDARRARARARTSRGSREGILTMRGIVSSLRTPKYEGW